MIFIISEELFVLFDVGIECVVEIVKCGLFF